MRSFVFISFISTMLFAALINVPDEYSTIQAGINASENGDTVLVHPGTYVENINFNGHNITLGSMFIMTGDTSFISQTVIDGNHSGSVVTINNVESPNALLSGLTITNGLANYGGGIYCQSTSAQLSNLMIISNSALYNGGGISLGTGSSVPISNSLVQGNTSNNGAGMYVDGSSPLLTNVTFDQNEAVDNGGGIYCLGQAEGINPDYQDVTITNNTASYGHGGGILLTGDMSPSLSGMIITGNSCALNGGGISLGTGSSVPISNSLVQGNTSNNGAGMYVDGSSPLLTNVTFDQNEAVDNGGGIYMLNCDNSQIQSSMLYENSSSGGGALNSDSSVISIISTQFIENSALYGAGIRARYGSTCEITKSLFHDNYQQEFHYKNAMHSRDSEIELGNCTFTSSAPIAAGGGIIVFEPGYSNISIENSVLWNSLSHEITSNSQGNQLTVSYSDIEGGESGINHLENLNLFWLEGNINEDPIFNNPENNDFTLQISSPCIDAGDPNSTPDQDCTIVDMGAFAVNQCEGFNPDWWNVLDIVYMVGCILNGLDDMDLCLCYDMTDDCILDVLDIVSVVDIILNS